MNKRDVSVEVSDHANQPIYPQSVVDMAVVNLPHPKGILTDNLIVWMRKVGK